MLKTIVIEDNEITRDLLIETIESTGIAQVIGNADNGLTGINLIRLKNPDLVFIDIKMEPIDGIETAKIINSIHNPPGIIFVTNQSNQAYKAFDLNAIDFLVKPFNLNRILTALSKAYHRLGIKNELIIFKINNEFIYLHPEEIYFFEIINRKVLIRCKGKTFKINETLKDIEEKLINFNNFIKSHRSFIVNKLLIDKIVKFEGVSYEIIFRDFNKKALLSHEKLTLFT